MTDDRARLLIVDDEPINIQILASALKDRYKIQAANNGSNALKAASTAPLPDIILLDVIMPDMDGYAVLAELKANPLTQHIPVIFVTGLDDVEQKARGLEMGAADFISKPIDGGLLKLRVEHCLELKQD